MTAYNFLKEASLYLDYNDVVYNIDTSEIDFSQTFTETSYKVQTLHDTNYFEASVINKANPANFSFNMPVLRGTDLEVVVDRLLNCDTFNLYISTKQDVFKLSNCVITNGTFQIEKSRPLRLTIEGEASKLSKNETLPEDIQERSDVRLYNKVALPLVQLGEKDISSSVVSLNVELQNDIQWSPYTTVQGGIAAGTSSSEEGTMYPSNFTISKKILGGSISRYLNDETEEDAQTWNSNTSLRIKAGQEVDSTFYGFDFNITNCSFTNRASVGPVFTQAYDWRMTQNPASLSDVIIYNT
jgi:hypothetical protein